MQEKRIVKVPATTEEIVGRTTCDCCGADIREPLDFAVRDVEVRKRTGAVYPDGGFTETVEFDVCVKCFDEVLTPFITNRLGVKPRKTELDL